LPRGEKFPVKSKRKSQKKIFSLRKMGSKPEEDDDKKPIIITFVVGGLCYAEIRSVK